MESTTQEEDLKVVEHLGGKAVYERHSCRQNSAVNSVKLCQVGIEHMHSGALRENSTVSSEEARIIEDSEKLCQVGIEQVHRCTR
jgi:hypothetical protein